MPQQQHGSSPFWDAHSEGKRGGGGGGGGDLLFWGHFFFRISLLYVLRVCFAKHVSSCFCLGRVRTTFKIKGGALLAVGLSVIYRDRPLPSPSPARELITAILARLAVLVQVSRY